LLFQLFLFSIDRKKNKLKKKKKKKKNSVSLPFSFSSSVSFLSFFKSQYAAITILFLFFFPFFWNFLSEIHSCLEMQSTNPIRGGWIFSQKSRPFARLREREKSIEQLKISALVCISPLCNRSRDVAVLQKNSPYKVRFQLFLLWVSE